MSLNMVHNPEGYAININLREGPFYHYHRKDHLGNIREVWRAPYYYYQWGQSWEPVQRTQYYPSGLPWAEGTGAGVQPYKYNGKEFVEMHGYDMYDYHARGMYPAIMRFTTIDPLAEKYYSVSPYVYCKNNPINRIDPDGKQDVWVDGYYRTRDQRNKLLTNSKEEYVAASKSNTKADKIVTVSAAATVAAMYSIAVLSEVVNIAIKLEDSSTIDTKPNEVKNPYGSKGKLDHQKKVNELVDKAVEEYPDKRILQEKMIQTEGSNRIPDVQVVDPETGETIKIYEAERNPNSKRNILREKEYKRLGIPFETHPLK